MKFDEKTPLDLEQEPEQETAIETADTPIPDDDDMEEVQSDDGLEADDQADESDDEAGDEPALEMAEIEINGKRYQVPAEIKDGFLMDKDYRQKTQSLAEERRQVEARAAEIDQIRNVAQEELNARAHLIGINQRLEQYAQVNWNAWGDEDPVAAQKGWIEYQQLERQAGQIGQFLQTAEAKRTENAQQETAKRLQETRDFAEKNIPGWTPEIDAQVTDFAVKELGFPVETLIGAYSPPVYKTLHLAWIGAQTMKAATAKPSAARPQQPKIKPLNTISARSGAGPRDPAKIDDMDDYARIMNQRERHKSRR